MGGITDSEGLIATIQSICVLQIISIVMILIGIISSIYHTYKFKIKGDSSSDSTKHDQEREERRAPQYRNTYQGQNQQDDYLDYSDQQRSRSASHQTDRNYESRGPKKFCPVCGEEMNYVRAYEQWYCKKCLEYKDSGVVICPECENKLRKEDGSGRWYCEHCMGYKEPKGGDGRKKERPPPPPHRR